MPRAGPRRGAQFVLTKARARWRSLAKRYPSAATTGRKVTTACTAQLYADQGDAYIERTRGVRLG